MTAKQMGRAIIMPNLNPPVTDANGANAYREEIISALPKDSVFKPLMVLYLTDKTTSEVITQAYNAGVVAAKLYPAGATTNSDGGVTNIKNIYRSLETMQKLGMLYQHIVTIIQKMLWGNRRCDIITTLTHKIYCIFSGDMLKYNFQLRKITRYLS
jgi:dihydroorotase